MPPKQRSAYEDTKVPVHQTRGEIDGMLYGIGATGMAWMEGEHPRYPGARVVAVRFVRPEKVGDGTAPVAVRIIVPVPVTQVDRGRRVPLAQREVEQRMRQYHRLLHWYIKAQLEAVQAGLIQFTEAFFPHLEMTSGQTLYEHLGPQYLQAAAQGDIKPLALLPGGGD